jgi:hypothetical protein
VPRPESARPPDIQGGAGRRSFPGDSKRSVLRPDRSKRSYLVGSRFSLDPEHLDVVSLCLFCRRVGLALPSYRFGRASPTLRENQERLVQVLSMTGRACPTLRERPGDSSGQRSQEESHPGAHNEPKNLPRANPLATMTDATNLDSITICPSSKPEVPPGSRSTSLATKPTESPDQSHGRHQFKASADWGSKPRSSPIQSHARHRSRAGCPSRPGPARMNPISLPSNPPRPDPKKRTHP